MIQTVDEIVAWIATICFLFVVAKYSSKRLRIKKLDRFLMKIHKPFAKIIIILGLVHGILSFINFKEYSIFVYITGILCLLAMMMSGKSLKLHKRKQGMNHHRMWSAIGMVVLLIHFVMHVHLRVSFR